jgi:hypothetical protein
MRSCKFKSLTLLISGTTALIFYLITNNLQLNIMTKSQWNSLRVGVNVKKHSWDIDRTVTPNVPKNVVFLGKIVRFNSNASQVLIEYESGSNVWEGRTTIELA